MKFLAAPSFAPRIALLSALTLLAAPASSLRAQEAEETEPSPVEDTVLLKIDLNDKTRSVLIRLASAEAPQTTANFLKLVSEEFYDGLAFHRVIRDYLVQTGDPYSRNESQKHLWGTGSPGYTVPSEIGLPHRRGSVGMARLRNPSNSKKASSGSQFYIMLRDAPELDAEYTVFGEVVDGLEVLDEMASTLVDSNDNPVGRIEIKTAKLGGPGIMDSIPNPIAAIPNPLKMFGKDDDTAPAPQPASPRKRKTRKSDAEKGALTRFIERVW